MFRTQKLEVKAKFSYAGSFQSHVVADKTKACSPQHMCYS